MNRKQKYKLYEEIVNRAMELGIKVQNKFSTMMDIECADLTFNLRLQDWLEADDFNFSHDFYGIKNCIVRDKYPTNNFGYFVPRFAGK